MISAYAAGVVVGAPTIAVFAARLPRKGLLPGCWSAHSPSARCVGARAELRAAGRRALRRGPAARRLLRHRLARRLVADGPGQARARGGVRALGPDDRERRSACRRSPSSASSAGWRAAYVAVALVFALAVLAIWSSCHANPATRTPRRRASWAASSTSGLARAAASAPIGFGGFFAVLHLHRADGHRGRRACRPASCRSCSS